jgi:hypothetical protein
MGWDESSRSSLRKKGKCSCVSLPKGRGAFIAGRRLDNYKLIIFYILDGIYMTNGSSLEIVGWLRSVQDFHVVWTCSGVFQSPSLYSPGPPWQWGEWRPGRFVERLFSKIFAWHRRLPLWREVEDRLAYPLHQPMAHSRLLRKLPGTSLSARSFVLSGTYS